MCYNILRDSKYFSLLKIFFTQPLPRLHSGTATNGDGNTTRSDTVTHNAYFLLQFRHVRQSTPRHHVQADKGKLREQDIPGQDTFMAFQ